MTNTQRKCKSNGGRGVEKRAVFVVFHLPLGEKRAKSKKGNFLQRREPDWVTLVITTIIIASKITMVIVL